MGSINIIATVMNMRAAKKMMKGRVTLAITLTLDPQSALKTQ